MNKINEILTFEYTEPAKKLKKVYWYMCVGILFFPSIKLLNFNVLGIEGTINNNYFQLIAIMIVYLFISVAYIKTTEIERSDMKNYNVMKLKKLVSEFEVSDEKFNLRINDAKETINSNKTICNTIEHRRAVLENALVDTQIKIKEVDVNRVSIDIISELNEIIKKLSDEEAELKQSIKNLFDESRSFSEEVIDIEYSRKLLKMKLNRAESLIESTNKLYQWHNFVDYILPSILTVILTIYQIAYFVM